MKLYIAVDPRYRPVTGLTKDDAYVITSGGRSRDAITAMYSSLKKGRETWISCSPNNYRSKYLGYPCIIDHEPSTYEGEWEWDFAFTEDKMLDYGTGSGMFVPIVPLRDKKLPAGAETWNYSKLMKPTILMTQAAANNRPTQFLDICAKARKIDPNLVLDIHVTSKKGSGDVGDQGITPTEAARLIRASRMNNFFIGGKDEQALRSLLKKLGR